MISENKTLVYPEQWSTHKGFSKLFKPGQLTFGMIAPTKGYPTSPLPDMSDHEQIVKKAEEVGIHALWLRDVPFYDPNFGDVAQVYDPIAYAGWLIAKTKEIIIGTAGMVLPLRDPLLIAKQALSLDVLSGQRFILGIAGGDRPTEYPAFGFDYETSRERFRDAVDVIKAAATQDFPIHKSKYYGQLSGNLDMHPKTPSRQIPIINIGRAGQAVNWIAENTDGWFWHGTQAMEVPQIMDMWKKLNGDKYSPYGYSNFFDLAENPDAPIQLRGIFLQGGRNRLIEYWKRQRDNGLSHLLLNLKPSTRNAMEVLDEFGEYILPAFAG